FVGGILGGIGGVSGAIPTLWCTLRGMEKDRQRAVIQNFNLGMLGVTLAGYVGTGVIGRETLPMLGIVLPAMLIPTLIGTRLYIGISDAAFRRIVLGLLTASGLAMLAAALPKLL
ncbi:MAG: TSUP family transporter, partial [Ferrovibrio sp.]